ncbi:hypothetical protein IJX73_00850 [bacterium]|nr:hypothetical protein [bacterium]MBQ9149457.1 hypothetical protein [bacterium]
MKNDVIAQKYNLLNSSEYQQIKIFQLENILRLANSDIEPLLIKGMLKNIADTDKWENDFFQECKKINKR